ncbi:MAG TPA: hypothetical protein VNV18_14540 [Stellaceae bacterium]|jgi:hypothetical protein|nr:hypothetical protein [Stellaceae bacterium]
MSNETEGSGAAVSRRLVMRGAAGALGAAAIVAMRAEQVAAAPKISKAAVAYQDHPQDDKSCGRCLQFLPPESCKMVDGPVSPHGFCRIFMLRQAA